MYENELEDIIEAVNEMKAQKRVQDLAVQQEGAVNANSAEAEAQASQDALSPASFALDLIASGALNSTSAPDIASSNAQNFTSLNTKNSTSRFVSSDALNSAFDHSNSMASKSSTYSSAEFTAEKTSVYFSSAPGAKSSSDPSECDAAGGEAEGSRKIAVFENGVPLNFDEALAKKILGEKEVEILVKLQDGKAEGRAWGCDLTYDYVKINGDYRT